ncbi:MAG: N-acetyltransferase [Paracoccaceae bacterium]|jgi:predicted N-acetyltransferase YhbS
MHELHIEQPQDWWEVEALFDLCFAPAREALSSYRLRDDVPPVGDLCMVAREEGVISGAIRYWPVQITGQRALLLGPVAVHPTHQGEGLGAHLLNHSLAVAKDLGWSRAMLVGDHGYYSRVGFERLEQVKMPPPTDPARVLGRALIEGAWENIQGLVEKA